MTLAAHPPVHLADLLEFQKEALIQRWARLVSERLQFGASHRAELVDGLPDFLDELSGLFIARQIVLGHGGGIGVRSTHEEGTPFTLRLPRRPSTPSS